MTRTFADVNIPRELIVLGICDRAIGLRFVYPDVDTDLQEAVKRHFLPARVVDQDPDLVLTVKRAPHPTRFDGEPIEQFRGIELRRAADGRYQAWSKRSVFEWNQDIGEVVVAPDANPHEAALGVAMMIHSMAGTESITPVHAGMICGREGASLIIGASGQGKSTTIGASLRGGLTIGSDDSVFIRSTSDGDREGFEVQGLPRSPMIPAEILSQNYTNGMTRDYRDRVVLPEVSIALGWVPLRWLVFVEHGVADKSELFDIDRPAATRKLIASVTSRFADDDTSKRRIGEMASLSSLPRYRLALGRDPATRAESTARVLRDLLLDSDAQPLAY